MLRKRIIPTLLLKGDSLVKTVRFKKPSYIGDPINTCRIFNELEVDELCFLDIEASKLKKEPDFNLLEEISSECFMPLSYGGGIDSLQKAERILRLGFEKVVVNSAAYTQPKLIESLSNTFGAQAVTASVDVKKNIWGKPESFYLSGTKKTGLSPAEAVKKMEDMGAGEILLNCIDREGTWKGYDTALIQSVSQSTQLPVIVNGGAGKLSDLKEAVKLGGASALSLGNMVVYQQKGMGILINFPDKEELHTLLDL